MKTLPSHTMRLQPDPECSQCNGCGWCVVQLKDDEVRTVCGCLSYQIDMLPDEARIEILAIDDRVPISINLPKVFLKNLQN